MSVLETRATSALLYLDGVHVSFDGFHAINNLSLTLAPGEMRAIIGPNGAGKTTMMDIITGKTNLMKGCAVRRRHRLTRLDETRIAELGSAGNSRSRRCSRARPSKTICCWRSMSITGQGYAVLAGDQGRVRTHRACAGNIRLKDARNRLAGSLSHGQKQWLEIGCCWRRIRNCCWSTSRSPA